MQEGFISTQCTSEIIVSYNSRNIYCKKMFLNLFFAAIFDDKKFLACSVLPKPSGPLRVADFAIFMKETRLVVSQEAGN